MTGVQSNARTEDQHLKVLECIRNFVKENHYSPTLTEIGEILGLRSKAIVASHLKTLRELGFVTWQPAQERKAQHEESTLMSWLRASLVVQIILAVYFQLILWFPLGSWNEQPGKRLITLFSEGHALAVLGFALVMLLPVLLFALALWKRWIWLIWLGLIGYGVWAALQIQSWWIPWIFGANKVAIKNQQFLEKTYKIFPLSTTHPAPDGMHFVLDVIIFLAVATIAVGLFSTKRKSTESLT